MSTVAKNIEKIVRVAIPLGVSAALVVWLFHKVDLHQIEQIMSQGVDYRFLVLMMLTTMLSYIIRGIRWGIQLRAAGIPRIPAMTECVSIFGAYALNLIITYLGEAWRCVYISRRGKCKLSTVVGTDLGDRASDGVMILLFLGLTLVVGRPYIDRFLDRYPLGKTIDHLTTDPTLWIWLAVIIAALAVADRLLRHTSVVKGINTSIKRIWDGFAVLFHMKGTGLYIILTFGIWICYFLNTYLCFFAFPFTRELIQQPGSVGGLLPGLVVFVFGSCSMAVPSSGGLGPWNIAVMFALTLFGIGQADAVAYSIVCWSFQAAMIIALGVFSALYIMISRRRQDTIHTSA
ncbi:MAG: flippase-like domain-containing protein [Muribaculaceae bacterium]|nr:flippase-like domain-containing protein [Muribaculaceae bacterium]